VTSLFHSVDIETGESTRVKFKIDMHTENEAGASVQKQNFTPILLQGSNHWKSLALMDPDYNITKFSFERFTDGFIPRLLFVQKKFSSDINKKLLERVIRKRRLVTEKDIKPADIHKMFGNHLFKFFYKILQLHSKSGNEVGEENLRYLGLEAATNTSSSNEEPYFFECNELLDVYYSVLEHNRPFFIFEYLEFLMVGAQSDFNLFSKFRNIFSKDATSLDDIRILTKFYSQSIKDGRTIKNFESNIYKIKNFLKQQLKFTEKEKLVIKYIVDYLKAKQRLPDLVSKFKRVSEFRCFMVKLKLNEVVLPTLLLKIANNCRSVKEKILEDPRVPNNHARITQIISENPLIKEYGLSDIISTLVE